MIFCSKTILCKRKRNLPENMMEEINPAITEKHEFGCRYKSKVIALYGIFGLSVMSCKEQSQWFFNRKLFLKWKIFNVYLDERTEYCFLANKAVQHRGNSFLIAVFGILPMWGLRNDVFQQKCFWVKFVFSEPENTIIVE